MQQLLEAHAQVERVKLVRKLTFPTVQRRELGLPGGVDACVFELDGVLTPSAELHFAAWATALDGLLVRRFAGASVHLAHMARLSRRDDYQQYLHGTPRLEGLYAFLASRGLTLPEGAASDAPGMETIHGIANAKQHALRELLKTEGVEAYAGASSYLQALAGSGLASVVVSASTNTTEFLARADLADLVDGVVDGAAMRDLGLRPKPAADVVLAACEQLDLPPSRVASFETTSAGIEAAHTAKVGLAVFVDRHEFGTASATADRVIGDLGELLVRGA